MRAVSTVWVEYMRVYSPENFNLTVEMKETFDIYLRMVCKNNREPSIMLFWLTVISD